MMTCNMPASTLSLASLLAAGALGLAGCAHAPLTETADLGWRKSPAATTTTLGLWRFDETTGLSFADSGPDHRDGFLGIDTRSEFGRYRNARLFTKSINSFAMVPATHIHFRFALENH